MNGQEYYIDTACGKVHVKLEFPQEKADQYHLLILIPGLTGHIEETHILAAAQTAREEGYATLRAELFGHGKSEGRFIDHNLLIWMSQAMRVIDHARKLEFVSDVILSGHSQGGMTTVLAGGMMADCLKALIPMSPATVIKYGAIEGLLLGRRFDPEKLPEAIHLHDEFTLSSDYLRTAKILPLDECVDRFKKPVLVIHGDEDESVDYKYGQRLASQYADAKLVTILGDDHCYNRHPDKVTAALREFLREQKERTV